jgi:hypothetical protein
MILLFGPRYSKNHKTDGRPSCFRIGNEKPLVLFFQIAFGKKW